MGIPLGLILDNKKPRVNEAEIIIQLLTKLSSTGIVHCIAYGRYFKAALLTAKLQYKLVG